MLQKLKKKENIIFLKNHTSEFKKFDKRLFKEALNCTFKEVTIKNPNFNTFEINDEGDESKSVNWDLVNQTVEIYLNNE